MIMQKKSICLLTCGLLAATVLTGCRQQEVLEKEDQGKSVIAEETIEEKETPSEIAENMSEDFYYIIEDVFVLYDRDVVVVGVNENSAIYTGAEIDILSVNGRIQSQILGIEMYDAGIVDSAEMGTNVGVWLSGVTKDDVKQGDIIVLRGQGTVADKMTAFVAMMPVGDEMNYAELKEGQDVQIRLFDTLLEAKIASTELISEETDGDIVSIELQFTAPVAYVNNQMLVVVDEENNTIAAGRSFLDYRFY